MSKKPTRHYVDNQKFFAEIVEYRKKLTAAREEGKPDPRIPDYIGSCIWKIAEKLSTKPCFINYSYREEMIGDGIENCFLYFKDYDPEKGQNPFAYFTQVIYYAFLRRIYKEERNRYAMYKNFQENVLSMNDTSLFRDESDNMVVPVQMYDNINDFMEKFERKEKIKKEKRKQSKESLMSYYGE
jgi:hypothetical protein